ncbi:MAG: nucleotide exchange factor GrpE [Clostridia bacterium]|nr:nucleotide exchange factor GrpE [Clostridia bacterium]
MQETNKQDIENKETAQEPQEAKTEQTAEKAPKTEKTDNKKKIKKLEEDLAVANAKAEETNEKYVRMLAEYDNFRKRTAKEREGIYADAYADALAAILPVIDNLERAAGCDDAEGLKKGLELTLKGFVETLEKMGVHEIEAEGKPFDPNLHNAVMHVEDDGYGENEIVEVLMKGYQKGDKVIRYSMVKVAN